MDRIVTIERHIIDQQREHPEATGAFSDLLYDVALAAKIIARETTRAGLVEILGLAGKVNVQGERQMKLDVFANEAMIRVNSFTGRLAVMASEEDTGIIPIPEPYETGKYVLVFDPLDGSSNIDVNVSVGTIFGIYRRLSSIDQAGTLADCLQSGHNLVAAGYVIYGSSTVLVYTTGRGVHGFTLDPTMGEFLLSHPNIQSPTQARYYSVNQAYEPYWSEGVKAYTRWLQGIGDESDSPALSGRYIGSLVADFHRNLLSGGIFYYPANTNRPEGKLRLVYEAIPLAFIVEQAGGYASDGHRNILDIEPKDLHQRTPFFIGDRGLVKRAEAFISKYDEQK
ncbi:MAG TPA: class 1 fructose-bisphosphatase [Chloroflexi bacterium]|nr:class 1 fructose-bisphosphatase [Chloroflexota bacterium]